MSFLKYVLNGERSPRTEQGFPLRGGRVPFLKQDEIDDLPLSADVHVRTFRSDNADDMKAYVEVLDRIVNGLYFRALPDLEKFLDDEKCWLFCVRWAEVKAEVPEALYARTGGYLT